MANDVKNTRLRYLTGYSPSELEDRVNSLPFKVEIKSIVKDNKKWIVFFVLPETPSLNLVSD